MSVKAFRYLGFVEAASLLILLFIAMPLKYLSGLPEAVRVIGMLHGMLFIAYVLAGSILKDDLRWSNKKLVLACVVASVPFGPFLFDAVLFPEQHREISGRASQ